MASTLNGNNFILRADPDALGRAQMYCSLCKITFMASEVGSHTRSVDHTVRLVKHISSPHLGTCGNPLFNDWHFSVKQTQEAFASKLLQSFWREGGSSGNDAATSTLNQSEITTSPATPEERVSRSHIPALQWNTNDIIIELECEGQIFKVNKFVLSHASPVFSAAFSNDMSERATNHMKLEDIPLRTLELLLHFMHSEISGDEPEWECMESLKELLNASEKYQIEELKTLCFTKLYELRTIDNAAEIMVIIHLFQAEEDIKFLFNDYMLRNIGKITKTETYKEKVKEHPSAFIPLLTLMGQKNLEGSAFRGGNFDNLMRCGNCGFDHMQPIGNSMNVPEYRMPMSGPDFAGTQVIGGGTLGGYTSGFTRRPNPPQTPRANAASVGTLESWD